MLHALVALLVAVLTLALALVVFLLNVVAGHVCITLGVLLLFGIVYRLMNGGKTSR